MGYGFVLWWRPCRGVDGGGVYFFGGLVFLMVIRFWTVREDTGHGGARPTRV